MHKKREHHLHGIGYSFSPKIKMRPCKDDLFGKIYQKNQLRLQSLRKISNELNVWSHFVMKTLKLVKQNRPIPCAKD